MGKSRFQRAKLRHERNALLAARARIIAESERLQPDDGEEIQLDLNFGADFEDEAELDFVAAEEAAEPAAAQVSFGRAEQRFVANDDPPFDPPDNDNIFGEPDGEDEDVALEAPQPAAPAEEIGDAGHIEEPPFDAPDEDDEIFGKNPLPPAMALEDEGASSLQPVALAPTPTLNPTPEAENPAEPAPAWQPAPPIAIHASWDRAETADLFAAAATDPRMARAQITISRGGFDGALVHLANQEQPNLVIVDSTLRPAEVLSSLDRLARLVAQGVKVIVIGALNDVRLLRELAARGVDDYLVPPLKVDDLICAICKLYDVADESRVIAVIGARGGVGASTIAQNIAWSIAERQECGAALIDLDLAFGSAALNFAQGAPALSLSAALNGESEEGAIERIAARPTRRLSVFAAASELDESAAIDPPAVEALIARVRRASPYVVLDLPHAWTGWVRHALRIADDVLIVASPDLASLRDAKNIADALKTIRAEAPVVALSMVGAPKRPEIRFKDFTEALGAAPVAAFAFDAALHGASSVAGRMIGEVAPGSKAAQTIDALAAALTGKQPVTRKAAPAANTSEGAATLDLIHEAPLEDAYILRARAAAAIGACAPERLAPPPTRGTARGESVVIRTLGLLAASGAVLALLQSEAPGAVAAPPAAIALPLPEPERAAPADRYAFALELFAVARSTEAIALLERAAQEGYAPAQYRLAKAHELGEGVSADLPRARQWTERAAARGNARAMHDLGVYFARGDGAPIDEAAAYRWFRQAAQFGIADSQYNLGLFYERGHGGVSADAGEALFWFQLAALQGDEAAAERAAALQAALTPLQIEQASARAAAFRAQPLDPNANASPPEVVEEAIPEEAPPQEAEPSPDAAEPA